MRMNSVVQFLFKPGEGPASVVLIRVAVGMIFLTQGILKYIDPNMGVVRFTKIGFAHPYFTAHFVGADFSMFCSLIFLVFVGGGIWALDARRCPNAS